MQRRQLILVLGSLAAPWARGDTEWKPRAGQPPLYVEGEVTVLTWAAPSPYLRLVQRPLATIPPDLTAREIAPHKDRQATQSLLERAALPVSTDRVWQVRLPTLPRLIAWGMERPQIGHVVGVVGYAGPRIGGFQAMQAEVLFIGARGYPLRSERL